jgi:predicted  nucleic acid-binding Zn-ribbon protein
MTEESLEEVLTFGSEDKMQDESSQRRSGANAPSEPYSVPGASGKDPEKDDASEKEDNSRPPAVQDPYGRDLAAAAATGETVPLNKERKKRRKVDRSTRAAGVQSSANPALAAAAVGQDPARSDSPTARVRKMVDAYGDQIDKWKQYEACRDHARETMQGWSKKVNEMTRIALENAWTAGVTWTGTDLERLREDKNRLRVSMQEWRDLSEQQSAAITARDQRIATLEAQLAAAEQAARDAVSTSSTQQMQQGFHSCLQFVVPEELRSGSDVVGQVLALVQRVQQQQQELQLAQSQPKPQSTPQQQQNLQQQLDRQEQELVRLRRREQELSATLLRTEGRLQDAEDRIRRRRNEEREHVGRRGLSREDLRSAPRRVDEEPPSAAARRSVLDRLGPRDDPYPGAIPDRRLHSSVRVRSPATAQDALRSPNDRGADRGERQPLRKPAPRQKH